MGGAETRFHATLRGLNEVPATASPATGRLTLTISPDESTISFTLDYSGLSGAPGASHVHFGNKGTNGGVSFFFCGGGGKPACPTTTSGTVSGTVVAADVVGPAAQGIDPGDLADIIRAIRHGSAYANIHSAKYPAGEARGQVREGRFGEEDRDD
ncbi:MAG TPA: CHRD domain-containing protein [Polyangiaceae bacterium]|nr:CHRD domain-containing protein [Polyangiaceae bacterium]